MASQIQVVNNTAERHWQELISASAQLKEDAQDSKVSSNTGSTANIGEEKNSFPIGSNIMQRVQDDGQMSAKSEEKKYYDENIVAIKEEDLERTKKPERKRKQEPNIKASESTNEVSATRTFKKQKAEPYTFAAMHSDKPIVLIESPVIDTVASSPGSSGTTTEPLLSEQEDSNETEVAGNQNSDTTTRRRKQVTDQFKAASIERPRRSIKPVVPYGSGTAEQKARNKKPIEILQGSGLPLNQIPHVLRAIDKMKTSDDVLKGLHRLIYGRMGSKHDIKSHIRTFSGFRIQTPLDEIVLKEKLEKWKIAGLKDMCHLFGLKSSGDKQKVVDRVYDFLRNPRDMSAGNSKGKSGKKKSVAVKTKEANRNGSQQKRQNSKVKQPEMVEDSDISEEFEDLATHKIEVEQKDAGIMDPNLDFSDPLSDNENDDDADAKAVSELAQSS